MKKFVVAIVAVLYMGVSSGIAMDIHYCMGKMVGANLYGGLNEKCSKCGMKEKQGCCKDEHQFYKLNDSHKTALNDIQLQAPFIIITRLFLPFIGSVTLNADQLSIKNHSPPQYSGPSVRLLQSLFRI